MAKARRFSGLADDVVPPAPVPSSAVRADGAAAVSVFDGPVDFSSISSKGGSSPPKPNASPRWSRIPRLARRSAYCLAWRRRLFSARAAVSTSETLSATRRRLVTISSRSSS